MLNTLYMAAGEKQTIIADRFIFFKKCLFPVNIRVMDKYGLETGRFDSVTSKFEVDLQENSLFKIEITNGFFGQDIQIHSNPFWVRSDNIFDENSYGYLYISSVTAKYNYSRFKSTKAAQLTLTFFSNDSYELSSIASGSSFGDILDTSNTYFLNSVTNSDFEIEKGSSSSKNSPILERKRSNSYTFPTKFTFVLNNTFDLILCTYDVAKSMDYSIKYSS